MSSFADPKAIPDCVENATRRAPGLNDIHRMSFKPLAESTPVNGRVAVVGAGDGIELKCFALSFPGCEFEGVEASATMLSLAKTAFGPLASRVQLHHGYIAAAPKGPFDAASCLLTLHFTTKAERYRTLCEDHARLKPGGVFVAKHYSISQNPAELQRTSLYATAAGSQSPPMRLLITRTA